MKSVFRVFGLFFISTPNLMFAGQIGLGDFSSAATTQDFEVLGSSTISYVSPLLVGNDTFDGDDHLLRSSSKFGPVIGRTGTALSNDPGLSNASTGFIEIFLSEPPLRAGLYLGAEFPWSVDVKFYNEGNQLLGMLNFLGNGGDSAFAAWQADNGRISRILVAEQSPGGNIPLIIDDLLQEIPETGTIVLLLLCFPAFVLRRQR